MTLTSKRKWLFLLLAGLAVFAMLFAACGGGDDDDNDSAPTASADPGDDGDDSGDDAEDVTPTDGGDDDDDGGGDDDDTSDDPFEDLDQLAGEYEASTGRVTYESTDEEGTTTTFTIYSDAEGNRSRYDSVDDSGTFTLITTPEASFTCSSEEGGEGFCLQSEGSDSGAAGLFGIFSSPETLAAYVRAFDASGVDVETSTEEIAGTDTNCFEWSGEVEDDEGSGKVCFSESGLMLLGEFNSTTDGTSTTMRATDFSDEVSDSDFEPPYEVTEIPGG